MAFGFDRDSVLVRTKDGRNFVVVEAFNFTTKAGEVIQVPAGAESDGASTPPEIWPTLPPFGKYWMAAVLHDYLYRYTQRPKADCDRFFLEAMESLDVPVLERDTMYEGVHLLGWAAFNNDRKQENGGIQK